MSSSQQALSSDTTEPRGARKGGGGPIGRFILEVLQELRKVVVPSRREMAAYTVTVLGFVFVMIMIVFGLDIAFGWLSRLVFLGH